MVGVEGDVCILKDRDNKNVYLKGSLLIEQDAV